MDRYSPGSTARAAAPTPLCPACGGAVVSITTTVQVRYDVTLGEEQPALEVVRAQVTDCGWEDDSPADCPACGWRGEAGALRPPRA